MAGGHGRRLPCRLNSRAPGVMCGERQHPKEPQPMATNPIQFVNQVRSEVAKVVWPTRREVLLTTVMVFIMAALTSVFFFVVDLVIRGGLTAVLGYFG